MMIVSLPFLCFALFFTLYPTRLYLYATTIQRGKGTEKDENEISLLKRRDVDLVAVLETLAEQHITAYSLQQ